VQVKADRDELAVTESRYAEGESGSVAHFPQRFLLRARGSLLFELDGERTR
jgi:hypothetical protein